MRWQIRFGASEQGDRVRWESKGNCALDPLFRGFDYAKMDQERLQSRYGGTDKRTGYFQCTQYNCPVKLPHVVQANPVGSVNDIGPDVTRHTSEDAEREETPDCNFLSPRYL